MIALYVIIGIIILLFIYTVTTYNSLISLQNRLKESFSTMDVYLKKRWDLVPNLVETVKGYAKHESETLEKVVSLRATSYSDMPMNEKIDANKQLSQGIASILAIAENYPELKADTSFLNLSSQLSQIEDDIANSRKYYNACARIFNIKVQSFPSNIIANMFKFETSPMFEVTAEEKENVKVEF